MRARVAPPRHARAGKLIATPYLCSKRWFWEHMIVILGIRRPLGDAAVVRVHEGLRDCAAVDLTPRYSSHPYQGGLQAGRKPVANFPGRRRPLALLTILIRHPERPNHGPFRRLPEGIAESAARSTSRSCRQRSLYNETTAAAFCRRPRSAASACSTISRNPRRWRSRLPVKRFS